MISLLQGDSIKSFMKIVPLTTASGNRQGHRKQMEECKRLYRKSSKRITDKKKKIWNRRYSLRL